jgi:serine protease Do
VFSFFEFRNCFDFRASDFGFVMKRLCIVFVIIMNLVLSFSTQAAISINIGKPGSFAKLVEDVSPAVVNIVATTKGAVSIGSGFVFTEDGRVLTNDHVVTGATEIVVTLGEKKKLTAKIVASDQHLDVAILKIQQEGVYQFVELGSSSDARVGDWVMAIGNPFGFGHTVTAGIVSAKGRALGAGPYDDFIQTDASINPGNSGGPLFDMDGKVIGINTANVASGSGIGFAVPINLVKKILKPQSTQSAVKHGWIGLSVKEISEEQLKQLSGKASSAVEVIEVIPQGPADRAGVKRGDLIFVANDQAIPDAQALSQLIGQYAPDSLVVLKLMRGGKATTAKVTLGVLDNPDKAFAFPVTDDKNKNDFQLGIDVRDLESTDSFKQGILITNVHESSLAQEVGLSRGDLIIMLEDLPVSSVKDFKNKLSKIKVGEAIKLEVMRGPQRLFFAMKR